MLQTEKKTQKGQAMHVVCENGDEEVQSLHRALKTRAAYFPTYSAMRKLICNGQHWARAVIESFVVTRSDSESIFQQQFGENHGDDSCYLIYFDSGTILWISELL